MPGPTSLAPERIPNACGDTVRIHADVFYFFSCLMMKNGDSVSVRMLMVMRRVLLSVCVFVSVFFLPELCCDALFAVSLGRRIPAVQHGAGGHSLGPQHPVHPVRVLADLHHQLGAVHREEHVRQLRAGDPGQIPAEGERPNTAPLVPSGGASFFVLFLFSFFFFLKADIQ